MKTKAVRLYGKSDLRLEEFELPQIKEDVILARVVSDSICMSSYKAAIQGSDHKRVPDDIATNPIIIGHEFCGDILEVGSKWSAQFRKGDKFSIQPAINYQGSLNAPGYSFQFIGGDSQYVIIPNVVMEQGCLLKYEGDAFFYGSLAEPMSCIVGAYCANYHTENGSYVHKMGIKNGGKTAVLAGAGPMGMGFIDYAINGPIQPSLLVVTDIDQARLDRAALIFTTEMAAKNGVKLIYQNTAQGDAVADLMALTDGEGYDDVFVLAPVKAVIEQADKILGRDGCLDFFAGPTNPELRAEFNFYNVHYASTHVVGTSGGNTDDMIISLDLMAKGKLDPSVMVTHVGGLNSTIETTLHLPKIPGGKKLIYNFIDMELTAIADFEEKGKTDAMFAKLAEIVSRNKGLWSLEAEQYLLSNAKSI